MRSTRDSHRPSARASIAVMLLLVVVKVWLTSAQSLCAIGGSMHDDARFLLQAESILCGNWLGPYNELTLIKGPMFPIWLALVSWSGVPLLQAQHLLYAVAAGLMIVALVPLVPNRGARVWIFAALLFLPSTYTPDTLRVLRIGFYLGLTLMTLAGTVGIVAYRHRSAGCLVGWSCFAGAALGALWLTREEGVWILPFVVTGWLGGVVAQWRFAVAERVRRLLALSLAVVVPVVMVASVCWVNARVYGVWTVSELKRPGFSKTMELLQRIEQDDWHRYVPVPRDARMRAYAVSASFRELKPYLEGAVCAPWRRMGEADTGVTNEFAGAFFLWGLRTAVAAAGQYAQAGQADRYYASIASELEQAVKEGRLDLCSAPSMGLVPPLRAPLVAPFLRTSIQTLWWTMALRTVHVSDWEFSVGDPSLLEPFRRLTNNRLAPRWSPPARRKIMYFEDATEGRIPRAELVDAGIPMKTPRLVRWRVNMLQGIAFVYRLGMPIAVAAGLIVWIALVVRAFRTRSVSAAGVLAIGCLAAVITRVILVSYIDVASFRAVEQQYLAPCHVVLLVALALVACAWTYSERTSLSR